MSAFAQQEKIEVKEVLLSPIFVSAAMHHYEVWQDKDTPDMFYEYIVKGRLQNFARMIDAANLDKVISQYEYPSRPLVVALGDGPGTLIRNTVRRHPRIHGIGIDISKAMIERAKKDAQIIEIENRDREPEKRMKLDYYVGDAQSTNLPSNSVDVSFSSHLPQWVPDLYAFFNEDWRILKPGGASVITTVKEHSYGPAKKAAKILTDKDIFGFKTFDAKGLRYILERVGFKVDYVRDLDDEISKSVNHYEGRVRVLTNSNHEKIFKNPLVVKYLANELIEVDYLLAESPIMAVVRKPE